VKIKQVHFQKHFQKICSLLANFSLFLHIFLPYLSAIPAYAEDPIPTPVPTSIVENTSTIEPTIAPTETPAEPTAEPTAIPTLEPTAEPTAIPTPEPTVEPTVIPTVEPTLEPTITPIVTETPTVTPTSEPTSIPVLEPISEPTPTETINTDIGTQAPVVETEIAPTAIPVVEKVCLTGGEIIEDATSEDWIIDDVTGISQTKENVKLGLRYVYPQDTKVTIIFKCLPADESLRTLLKIQKIKSSDLKLPDELGDIGEYAYDITTGMSDGIFEYDVTLPKPDDSTAEISYIEKSADDAKNNEIKVDEVKQVEESKVEQQSTSVKALSLDHFTLFIISNGALLSVSGSFNGVTQVTVDPNTSIEVDLNVERSGGGSNNDWESTSWKIDEGSWICEDHADHEWFDGTSSESFNITAPSTVGTYDVSFRAHRDNSCGNTGVSNTFTLTDGIIVSNTPSIVTPVLPNNPSDDYALTSVSGVWTSVSGGSNVIGTNTNEVRWGNSTGSGQSGLRFDGSGVQTFNTGTNFYLGALTHFNWPITNAANGARLKITLQFSKPSISPDPDFSYDFVIDETTNNWPCNSGWQQSGTACDDKISFPTSYGSKSFTIDDKLYTLRIVGFVNSYPSGSPVSQFITEEQKNNTAYLIGTLSSVLVERPDISIIKKTNDQDISSAPGDNLTVGDIVNWSYVIQNTGNVNLSGISVVDNPVASISCPNTSLTSGSSMICTASGTVQLGQFTNTATVTANHANGTVNDSDSSWYFGIANVSCGDGVINQNSEQCDNGSSNGSVCTPTYGNSCNYCSVSCQNVTVTGPYCGDGAVNGSEQCDGNDLGNLSTNDFKCNKSCELELIEAKIDICHASRSHSNPYIINHPNKSGDVSGHAGHTGPIWYPGITVSWGDIIPPFDYLDNGVVKNFIGLNWTTEGQAVYNNGCNFAKGHLIVQKTTVPSNDNTSFSISASGTGDITGSSLGAIKDNQDKDYEVTPGVYSVTETVPSGWIKTGDTCQNITVNAGETKYCLITNTKKGSLKIIKDSQPNDTQNFAFTLKDTNDNTKGSAVLDDDGESFYRPNNHTFTNLIAGTYKVTEDPVSGWTLDNINCTNTTGDWKFENGYLSVDINPGEQPVCTFINTRDTGTITIIKDAIYNSEYNFYFDSNFPSGDFELEDDGTSGNGGTPETRTFTLPTGSYWVNEREDIDGWKLTDIVCSGDDHININKTTGKVEFDLDKGKNVICTYTNTKTSSIKVIKQSNPENTQNFWFTLSGVGSVELDDYSGSSRPNNHTFNSLLPGTYTLSENEVDGWYLDSISCSGISNSSVRKDISNRKVEIDVSAGQNPVCTFNNYKYGSIKVCKVIIDGSGNIVDGSEVAGTTFTIDWDKELADSVFTAGDTPNSKIFANSESNDAYCVDYPNLKIDSYNYSQENINGDTSIWEITKYNDQYESSIDDLGDFYTYGQNTDSNGEINLALDPPGIDRTLVILNQYKFGQITVTKFNDVNGDGQYDKDNEDTLPDWSINLSGESKVTTIKGATFDQLLPDTYYLSETMQVGWSQTNIYCDNEFNDSEIPSFRALIALPTGHPVNIDAGDNIQCFIGNKRLNPQLTIAKSNDAEGEDRTPGSSVGFNIRVTVLNNDIDDLIVTDLLSEGFVYRPGTFKVQNLTTDDSIAIEEPKYQSPGTWNIGDVKAGDVIELSYLADIDSDQQPGLYKDLAYARGVAAYDNKVNVIATSEEMGYVNNNLVGTEVPIVKSTQNSVSAGVEREVEGQVLGASTELPATGASTIWLIISALMSLIGLAFIKKSAFKFATFLFLTIFSLFFVGGVKAVDVDSLSVRLEQPKSPTNINDLKLTFVALDLDNKAITVKCFKKGPSDSGYSQFGADIPLDAPGDTSQCETNSSLLNTEGTYNFYVTANGEESNVVSLDYKTSGPGTPSDYRKEWLNGGCDYKIHFKTADDGGKTVKVELYRADITDFILDSGSRVASINIDSNQESTITNTVPDCSKSYYYVLRAFDDAGNGSGTIGDTVTITKTSTTIGTTTTTAGAIPVTNATISPEEESTLLTGTPAPEDMATDNKEGTVLGTAVNTVKSFIQKSWLPLGLGLIGLFAIIRYALKKKKRSSYR
jgi:hypothetical protein